MTLKDSLAFVSDRLSGLQILSVANPTSPYLVGSYDTPGETRETQTYGDYAFLADGLNGIVVLNVANPATPFLVSTFDTPGTARAIQIQGQYAYVADYTTPLIVLNILDPNFLVFADSVSYNDLAPSSYHTTLEIHGDYVYLASNDINVVNKSVPTSTYKAGSLRLPGISNFVGGGAALVDDSLVYVPGHSGLSIYSISFNPPFCGDADGSGIISISDAVHLINYVFNGGPAPDPLPSGDVDCSGSITISDAVYLINYVFAGGAAPCEACN